MAHDLVFLENRRTPKVVSQGAKYTPTEAEGKIKSRRKATADEEKVISRGDWVRVNEHGDKPSDSGYKRKKSKVRPGPHTNAVTPGQSVTMSSEPGQFMLALMVAAAGPEEDGYDGVTHAGLAVVAADTGRVLLAQRSMDPTDDAAVQETWEFPGGGLDEGEEAFAGASREFREETGLPFPAGEVTGGWRSDDGIYQGFVYTIDHEFPLATWTPTDEVQRLGWMTREDIAKMGDYNMTLRPEVESGTDWDMIFNPVSGNPSEEDPMTAAATEAEPTDDTEPVDDTEPEYTPEAFDLDEMPVHGVVAPEEMSSGDKRAFSKGAMTRRPLSIPFSDQHVSIGGHDGSVVVGRVDRMMRKDGLIHWEGALMASPDTENLVARMHFFGGRYGVSVDGDQGSLDAERSEETGTVWFDQVRASGLTAVAIPAFHEAYVGFGAHPEMPSDETLAASAYDSGDLIGAQSQTFARGPGWVTDPKATNRIHDYWTKKGQPGYAKVAWGTPGDFTRAKKLIGAKIAEHSPDKMRFLNQIIAQWHFDALGYWPGDLGKPGNAPDTAENRKRAARHAASGRMVDKEFTDEVTALITKGLERDDIEATDEEESVWETILVSSAVSGNVKRPPVNYFHQHPTMLDDPWAAPSAALVVDEPDDLGFQRAWGYAGEWGVCHVGMDGRCVEPPQSGSDDYPDFHLGVTKTQEGVIYTGVLTCGVGHRDAETMLAESPEQAMFDNINNAWASVRVGENERGIWFSGVVLPRVDADLLVKIEASGQVSGEWLAGAMRACLTVNVPGFPNRRPSAVYDAQGNVMALAASAFGGVPNSPCSATEEDPIGELALAVMERMTAREKMLSIKRADADRRFANLKQNWSL